MTCAVSKACRPAVVYWLEGKSYCRIHYEWFRFPHMHAAIHPLDFAARQDLRGTSTTKLATEHYDRNR